MTTDTAEPPEITVERFRPGLRGAFLRLHSDANDAGWCRCVAWWVPTWDGWSDRTNAENLALREALCDAGEYDGLLAFAGDEPVGWCQVGPRDRLAKLVAQLGLERDARVWSVTCFLVAPPWRHRGVATALLEAAIAAAESAGARRLEAYPRADEHDDQWTGPLALYVRRGFVVRAPGTPRSIVSLDLASPLVGRR